MDNILTCPICGAKVIYGQSHNCFLENPADNYFNLTERVRIMKQTIVFTLELLDDIAKAYQDVNNLDTSLIHRIDMARKDIERELSRKTN